MALMIQCFGIRWKRSEVEFGKRGRGNKGRLLGFRKEDKARRPIDLWQKTGVYVLYHDLELMYVGRACIGDGSLGDRLAAHNRSRTKSSLWNQLSWAGFRKVNRDGSLQPERDPGRIISPSEIGKTFEGLLIQMLNPRLNKRGGDLAHILEMYQYPVPK